MSELNYKELQEKGVFDVPYKAFQFMQHQQSKIDELTKQRDSFIKAYEIEIDKSVELQKRIDEISNHVEINYDENRDDDSHSYWSGYNQALRELFEILKGGETK